MAINVEIISKEVIKPSSPTPPHLRKLKLSFLDQIAPPNHVPFIFFYQPENTRTENCSRSLKQSLSQNLTRFYPLAGRLSDDGVSVDCNDAGVEYVEGRVDSQSISQIIENPNLEELPKLLPINPYDLSKNHALVAIQINFFDCGGVAVAVCVSHRIADGISMISFIKSWAAQSLCKSSTESIDIPNPDFDSARKLFPPIDLSGFMRDHSTQEHVVTKRLVFDKEKIAKLKQDLKTSSITPTSVEAVSAFIWKQLIKVSKAKSIGNEEKLYIGVHSVNLRPKADPPLGDNAFGNIWINVSAVSAGEDEQAVEFRKAIRKIDGDYVKSLKDGEKYVNYIKKLTEEFAEGGKIEFVGFSSWCRFPFYEVEFCDLGKPVWVCITTMPIKNFGILTSTRDGDGIDVWFSTVESDMAFLEAQLNLL